MCVLNARQTCLDKKAKKSFRHRHFPKHFPTQYVTVTGVTVTLFDSIINDLLATLAGNVVTVME
jgi:hypothetical protein